MIKGPTSYITKGLINKFEKLARTEKKPIFERIVKELRKVRRQKRVLNLSKINRYSIKDSNILVIGKILGSGELKHSVNIIAFEYSETAIKKLKESKSKIITLEEWADKPVIPNKVIILG